MTAINIAAATTPATMGMTNLGQRGSTTGRLPPGRCAPGTLKLTALPFAGLRRFARLATR